MLVEKLSDLQRAFVKMAKEQGTHPMPSFTHLQRAQPVVAGHEMLAYCEMLERDKGRLADCFTRVNISPLGAGAVAGPSVMLFVNHIGEVAGNQYHSLDTGIIDFPGKLCLVFDG